MRRGSCEPAPLQLGRQRGPFFSPLHAGANTWAHNGGGPSTLCSLSLSLQEPLLDVTRLKETEWMVFVYCTLKKQAKKLGVAPCLRRRPASSSTPLVSAKGLAGRAPSV